jgi:hypothetical protein
MTEKLEKEHKTFVRAFWLSWAIWIVIIILSEVFYY